MSICAIAQPKLAGLDGDRGELRLFDRIPLPVAADEWQYQEIGLEIGVRPRRGCIPKTAR